MIFISLEQNSSCGYLINPIYTVHVLRLLPVLHICYLGKQSYANQHGLRCLSDREAHKAENI